MDSGKDKVAQVTFQGSVCPFKKCLDVGWPLESCTPYQVEGNWPSHCGHCQTHCPPVLPLEVCQKLSSSLEVGRQEALASDEASL